MAPTTFADIHPYIIQTHILPRLDGLSLSTTAAASSFLQNLCSDHHLWSEICKSNWPAIAHPRVDDIISTFPDGHLSFFRDSFPVLFTEDIHRWGGSNRQLVCPTSHPDLPSQLISAIDIRYQNDVVYSRVNFIDTTTDFLSPAVWIELNDDPCKSRPVPGISRPIYLKVDELSGADDATLSHLKESVTLNWILIDPALKRSGNLSSIKPAMARKHWTTNEIHLRYVTVLPGCDPNEMVQCRIDVTWAVGKGGVGLHVKEVVLNTQDLDGSCLSGEEFLVITQRAISQENNVHRTKVVGVKEIEKRYDEFKEMKREKIERVKKEERKRELVNYFLIMTSFLLSMYYGGLLFL